MSVEMTIVCDACSRVIAAASTAKRAREENREMGGISQPPSDWCAECAERSREAEAVVAALRGERLSR